MAFSYWRTGTYPANQGGQGTQRDNGFDNYGYQNYVQAKYCKQQLRTDLITVSLWTPDLLGSSLKGWLQADHVGGANGSAITSWHDDSGGTDATSLGNDPDLAQAFVNNLNAVNFTGANIDLLTWTNVSSYTEGALFLVARAKSASASVSLPVGRMGTAGAFEQYNNGGVSSGTLTSEFLSNAVQTVTGFGDPSPWHILGLTSKASDWRARKNGLQIFSTVTNTVAGFAGSSLIGRDDIGGPNFDGYLAEVILCNVVPVLADQQKIEGYLAWKWGLVSALDAAHPYKSVPPKPPTYTLAVDAGSYSLTGTATGLAAQRKLAAAVGSYSITGTTTALRIARKQVEAVGSYVITGTATALRATRTLALAPGSYSITGVATTFKVSMPSSVGSYAITGTATGLRAARRLSGAVGSYSITGHATGLSVKLPIDPGAYVLTGTSVNLTYHTAVTGVIQVTPGVYSLTGSTVGLKWGRHIRPAIGSYALTGTDIDFIYHSLWNVESHPGAAGWTPSPSIAAGLWTKEPGPTQLEWSN